MRVMKFAVVLCFSVAFIALVNYPHPATVHGAARKVTTRFANGSGQDNVDIHDVSASICANCHQTINHVAFDSGADTSSDECQVCHSTGYGGMITTSAGGETTLSWTESSHISLLYADDQCIACHAPASMTQ
jgi:hypothetical protein